MRLAILLALGLAGSTDVCGGPAGRSVVGERPGIEPGLSPGPALAGARAGDPAGIAAASAARAAEFAIEPSRHYFEIDRSARVRCAPDGALFVACGGEVLRGQPGPLFETSARNTTSAVGPDLALLAAGGELPAARARRLAEVDWRGLPHRDRHMFGHGLREPDVVGGARSGGGEIYWYGTATTGLTLHAGGAWRDLATSYHVFDTDVAPDGTIWAVTDRGLVRVPHGAGETPQRARTAAFPPGNALDGAFTHHALVHVFGPKGLYSLVPVGVPPLWSTITDAPARDARSTPRGVAVLAGLGLWFFPGPKTLSKRMPAAIWKFGFTSDLKYYLATASGLYEWDPMRVEPVLDVYFGAPPRVLGCGTGVIVLGHTGPEPWVWIGRETEATMGPSLRGTRHELNARSVRVEPDRILIGTDDGLASIEGEKVHWYFRKLGLSVTAIERLPGYYVLATSEGLLLLDGPEVVAQHPLGGAGGDARVTALLWYGGELLATTVGQGLYTFKVNVPPGGTARGR